MKKTIIESVRVILMATIFSLGLGIAFAWTGPTASAPSGNVSAPVNLGSVSQIKQGNFWISGLNAAGAAYINGLIVENGNVGIGTTTPTSKLAVEGNLSVNGNIDVANNTITNVATPVNSSDVATKGYVDGLGSGPAGWTCTVRTKSGFGHSNIAITASCLSGEKVVSGGCLASIYQPQYSSYPSNQGWTCTVYNDSVSAYANCCK